jgi:hypothetical protein
MAQQPPWQPPPPQPPQQPGSAGGLVASIILGGALGMFAGFLMPFLPGFLAQLLFDVDIYGPGAGVLLGLVMLLTVPVGGILGALWGMRRAQRRRPPLDPSRYPNRVIRRRDDAS